MKTLYLYVEKEKIEKCTKYGIKLSEYVNKVINIKNNEKKGILAFLSPKDSELYYDEKNYACLKINTTNLNIFIFNKTAFNLTNNEEFICSFEDYIVGEYEEPLALICSSILPENINVYNKIIDSPLLIQDSKEYFYKKSILNMLDSDLFTSFEIYQLLLILAHKKGLFKLNQLDEKLKLYIDKKSNKKYTKKSNF